ncbi:hypothetical protein BKA82DRAFT_129091, partial [Pisolithus tinctorius]
LYDLRVDVSGMDGRTLIRKIDMRTISLIPFPYLCFPHQTSIGNAKINVMGPLFITITSADWFNSSTAWRHPSTSPH